jgi:hypothetical protein
MELGTVRQGEQGKGQGRGKTAWTGLVRVVQETGRGTQNKKRCEVIYVVAFES